MSKEKQGSSGRLPAAQGESYARVNTAKVIWREEKLESLQVSADELQPIRFQGQSFDEETGLHYNRFRYFDPDLGMFTTRDPIGLMGGMNIFQYAPNPVGWIDPWGLSGEEVTTYYHAGSDLTGVDIDPTRGGLNKDFNPKGQGGFYVTTDLSQAQEWQNARNHPKITQFDVPNSELGKLNIETFPSANKSWSNFVTQGRKGSLIHAFDAVVGPMLGNVRQFWHGAKPKPKGSQLAIFSKKAAQLFDKCKVN